MSAPEDSNIPETPQAGSPQPDPSAGEKVRGALSRVWRSKAMLPVRLAYYATSPAWYPALKAGQLALWGVKRQNKAAKVLVPAFAAAALGAYAMAAGYTATYGAVAAGDYYWFGKPYSQGERTGRIAKLSHVGKFPCDTLEGELAMPNLGSGGSSTFSFSARTLGPLNKSTVEALQKAYESGVPVSLTYKQSHWPKEKFDAEQEDWFVPVIDGFSCVQKSDYNIVAVKEKPGLDIPAVPRLPGMGQ
jgi:hypothetical protein